MTSRKRELADEDIWSALETRDEDYWHTNEQDSEGELSDSDNIFKMNSDVNDIHFLIF